MIVRRQDVDRRTSQSDPCVRTTKEALRTRTKFKRPYLGRTVTILYLGRMLALHLGHASPCISLYAFHRCLDQSNSTLDTRPV